MLIVKEYAKKDKWGWMPNNVRNDMRISGDAYRLLDILWNCNNIPNKGQKAFTPSVKSLATIFKVTTRTIDRLISELKEFGYITTTGSRNNTTLHVNVKYVVKVNDKNVVKTNDKNVVLY